jgi:hypothetical protein
MRYLAILLFFVAGQVCGSNPPVSGTFSNAAERKLSGTFNLIVTASNRGQQFFIQCFKEETVGFGAVTEFTKARINATINAGSNCPSNKMEVRLDYEEAYIKIRDTWVPLPRGAIYVPIVD